jgi:hypothetical protein
MVNRTPPPLVFIGPNPCGFDNLKLHFCTVIPAKAGIQKPSQLWQLAPNTVRGRCPHLPVRPLFFAPARIPSCRKYNFTTKSMVNASPRPLLENINMPESKKNKGAVAIMINTSFVRPIFGQTDYRKPT